MNQPAMPATTGDILYPTRVMLFITLLCMGYELSRPIPAGKSAEDTLLPATIGKDPENKGWSDLPSWQREASAKAVEKYATTQEKKWRRWNEAMFER